MNRICLNLGCGRKPLKGYINFDKYVDGKDINYLDLEKLPLELPNDWADEILLIGVLEHLFVNPFMFTLSAEIWIIRFNSSL